MRVLLATDNSTEARIAAEWLTQWPLPDETTVLALIVAELPTSPVPLLTLKELREAVLGDAHRIAVETRKLLSARWPEAEVRVSEGDPREEILRIAEEWGAELIVCGARGLGTVKRAFWGSVSQAVTRHARCPVLVVRGRAGPMKSALVAVDGSPDSLHALEFFSCLPRGGSVNLCVLGVVQPLPYPSSAPGLLKRSLKAAREALHEQWRSEMEAMLARARECARGRVGQIELIVSVGAPAEEILRVAAERNVDLIVIGARGLGTMKRLALGSVSEKVLTSARRPVLVVKHPKGAFPVGLA